MSVLPLSLRSTIYGEDRFPDDWGASVALPIAHIQAGFAAFVNAKADIMADETMTPSARLLMLDKVYQERVAKHFPDAEAALSKAQEMPAFWQKEIDELFAPDASATGLALASEMRSALRAMKSDERMAALQQAKDRGDRIVLSAVMNAPEFLHGVDDARRSMLRDSYARQHHPEYVQRLSEAERFARTASESIASIRKLRSELFTPKEEKLIGEALASSARSARHLS
jgi:hypothetical protein